MFLRKLGFGVALIALCGAAQAAPITSLFNTGVDASGNTLANGSTAESHYTLVTVAGGTSTIATHTSAGGYPVGPWLADDSLSTWIGPNNDSSLDGPVGAYDYRTTFSLTGFNFATANITGQWSTDNEGTNILINGTSTGQVTSGGAAAYETFTPFSITSGFVSGLNTIDFLVNNDGGPTGLRVEATGTASPTAVPEPAAFALVGFGLAALAFVRRRAS